jgi:uncharacterized membrane protein (DUF373 family)
MELRAAAEEPWVEGKEQKMSAESLDEKTSDRFSPRFQEVLSKFEFVTVNALQVLLVLTVAIATVLLFVLFADGLRTQVPHIESLANLLPVVQRAFSGILMVLLGLELLETLRTYFSEHHIKVEVILVVAMIAAGRDIIEFDFAHTPGPQLLGYGVLILSLAVSYFVVRKANTDSPRQ